ncbi:MAG TPA: autotransporter-associated beta strand repeat-containing protein, partial [Chthoniobacteraceae bacterium]|nr:autotransporter-associated beta strand repeat-containing protein [Chthoniobacteraceae bacterium]
MNPSSRVLRPLLNRRVTAAHRGTRPKPLVQAISVLLAAAAAVSESRAADGTWMQLNFGDASGMWSDPAAWAGGVIANGPGFTANFATLDATLPGTIVLDAPRTIGNVLFGDTDPSTPANWTLSNNFDVANVLTLSGPAPTITANAAPGSTLTLNTVLAGTEGVTFAGNNTILSAGNPGHTYTGGTVLKTRVETTNVANAPLTIFGAALATNTLTFDGGYFKIFNTTAATSAGTLVNNLIVNTTGTLEYSGRSSTTGTLTGSGVLNVITHYVRSDNGGNWSGFTGTINVTSGDAGTSDFRQTTYNGFAGATVNLNTNSFLTFTLNQANTTNPLTGTAVDIGALSGVSSAILRGGAQNGRVTSFRIGAKNLDTTFAGAIETDTAVNRLSNVIKNGTGTLTLTGDRSAYNGPTFINDGTLAVAVLANGGSVSSIGRAPNTPDNLVINGGTFRYIGGGSSTDRLFTLGTNNPSLDASGSGPVNFTNGGGIALSGFDAARTITFTGTNSGGNSLAATLGDNGGGITSVTKSGPGTWALNGLNTYSGATTITGGVLSVSSLGNGGAASGIGQSGSAASSLVIDGGTIRYTGAVTSTDRAISVGTAGATLDASGTGAITFINPAGIELVGLDAARTLTLTGISTADNVLSAALPNNGAGATSLIKNGPGTWALTSANTYSGGTTINGGTLKANNTAGSATGSGSVIVNNTGAIGGFGNVSGAVTLNDGGHIAPGDGVGTLTLGSLTLSMGSVLDFEFNGTPANDRVTLSTLNGLTINGGGFNLFTEGSTNKWTAPGTYNLVQFTGGVGGTGPGALSVLNPQPGLNYAFAADSGFLRLVISATARLSNWILTTGGSWANAASWSNGIPNAQNDGANFTAGLSAPGTITLDGSKTVGTIQLNNPSAYTIAQGAGGSLILDSGGNAAAITVLNGSHTISAPVTLTSNTSVEVTTSTDMLTISGSISGNGTLAKTGAGTLALSGANLFPNGTTIHGGTVQIGSNGALGTGALAFASSGTLRAGADGLAATNSISVANAVTAVIDTVANT